MRPGGEELKPEFQQRYILFAGRMTCRKGLSPFFRKSLPSILQACPDSGLVVVGDDAGDSLNQRGEKAAVLAAIEKTGLKDRVMFLGQVDDRDLETAYACAAVHVFPLIEVPGDVEGFGMVAIEAAAVGTPTAAFSSGGISDALSVGNGILTQTSEYGQLVQAVVALLKTQETMKQPCLQHAQNFSWSTYNDKFSEIINPFS